MNSIASSLSTKDRAVYGSVVFQIRSVVDSLPRGNGRGEQDPPARCSPWIRLRRGIALGRRTRLARGGPVRQLQIIVQVAARRPRAALSAARLAAPRPERSPTAVPWREAPPEMAGWPARLAASEVVAHATAERVLAPRASAVSPLEAAVNPTRDLRRT